MKRSDLLIFKNRLIQNLNILWRRKFLWSHIFKSYIQRIFLKNKLIRQVEIALGYECNASCEQCSCASSLDKKRKRLILEEFKKIIDDSIKLGAFQFNLTGGEPLIYAQDTYELIKYIREKNCYAHLCTNGILLDAERIKELKELGLNSLEFGLDSANEETHDLNRQKGAYRKVMEATKAARKFGITVLWDTIITHEKIKNGDLAKLVILSREKGVFLQITPPCVIGRWSKRKEILLDEKEKDYFKKILSFSHVRTDTFSSYWKVGCPAAKEKLAVTPYGDILPCSLIQISYGNVRQQSLEKIWQKMLANRFYHRADGVLSCLPSFNRQFIDKYL